MDRDAAANLFLSMILARAREGVVDGLENELRQGPPGRKPDQRAAARHRWFQELSGDDQELVMETAREAVDAAIFGVLVILDGMSGGYPIRGVLSDFSLHVQTYANEEARRQDHPETSVRINPSDATSFLHDLFEWEREERRRG